jgi:D-serine deaminase-like pyridoxal phosphate-dependent protein
MTALARRQMEAGACGITCAKLGEAEVMASAGLDDIFIANCLVDRPRFARLARLSHDHRVSVGIDSAEASHAMSAFFSAHNQSIDVVLEIDTGHHRCGVIPERACEVAEYLSSLPGIRLKGIFTHEGQVYQAGTREERSARAERAGKQMARIAFALRERRISLEIVSVGSSPARDAACRVEGVTENRPGTNIFNDCSQVQLEACEWSDCALTYECTVISRPARDRAIIDGGSKTFSSDQLSTWTDVGSVVQYPGAKFFKASEEHGFLSLTDREAQSLQIGDRVRVIPNHACGSINLHNRAFVVRNGEVVDEWKIEARGCVD